ncbi:MAG: DUF3822 family protein [Bacteroidetes bacterium]|nr:DUF3822 family protein [Bacteroidota bacterium]
MEKLLWESRNPVQVGKGLMLYHKEDAYLQLLVLGETGEPALHLVLEDAKPDTLDRVKESYPDVRVFQAWFGTEFYLVPDAFAQARIPMTDVKLQRMDTGTGISLVFENTGQSMHMAAAAYKLALEGLQQHSHYAWLAIHQQRALLFCFENRQLILANVFPAENEQEALYFALAPFRKSGTALEKIRIDILTDATLLPAFLQAFRRFVPDTQAVASRLPYSDNENPPYHHISELLYALRQCELPVEI